MRRGSSSFGQLIQAARAKRGMSLKQLGAATAKSVSFLSRVEKGTRRPDLDFAIRLGIVLQLDPTMCFLAAAREQLPEELREYVPAPGGAAPFAAARDHQAWLFDFEVPRLRVSSVLGDRRFHVTRTFEQCRPRLNEGRVLHQMILREPVAAELPTEFAVRSVPPGIEYRFRTSRDGSSKLVHRFDFPDGWRRTPGNDAGFNLEVTSEVLVNSGPSGVFRVPIVNRVGELKISVKLPPGIVPQTWRRHFSVTGELSPDGNMNLVSRDSKLETKEASAALTVLEPLAGFSYGICWDCGGRDLIEASPLPVTLSS